MNNIGYEGYREGNFLSLMATIDGFIDRHFETFGRDGSSVLASLVDKSDFKQRIQDVFASLTNELNPSPLWFDKTGNADMIHVIPTLRRIWPDSVFIFAKRRAIENVLSRLKKFPQHSFEYHCMDWAKNMRAWRDMRVSLPSQCFTEVDQQDMLHKPDECAHNVIQLLGLDAEKEGVLRSTFFSNRAQETESGSAMKLHALESLPWTSEQKETFVANCDAEMKAYGYSYDSGYFANLAKS